jgi:hypothetical protein
MFEKPPANGTGITSSDGDRHSADVTSLSNARQAPARLPKKSKYEYDRLIDKFNSKYAVVNNNGELRVFCEVSDPLRTGRYNLHRFSFPDFRRMHMNRLLTLEVDDPKKPGKTTTITKSVADWWLASPYRREHLAGVIFDPTESCSPAYWNLWHGFAVAPRRGSWRLMQEHLFNVVCAGSLEHYNFLLGTAARMLQFPHLPAEVAVVLQGEEGAGKGIFVRALLRILGQHGLHLSHPEHLRGKHNAHLLYCVLLFCDEAFYAGDKQHESILKALITEEDIALEPKNKELHAAPNYLHVWMASNLAWVVPASLRARRWFVLRVSDHRVGDKKYFSMLVDEMEHGGLEAMLFDLLRRDLRDFDPRSIPMTTALAEQKLHSLDTLNRWWMTVLARRFVWRSRYGVRCFAEWAEFVTTELLERSYLQWCDDQRLYQRQTRVELGKFMSQLYSTSRPRQEFPIYEVITLPPGLRAQGSTAAVEGAPELPIGALPGATLVEDIDPLEKAAVIKAARQMGYKLGSLAEARARFSEIIGDLPMPW